MDSTLTAAAAPIDSTKPAAPAADSTKPAAPMDASAAELGAYFRVMRLGDDSSPRDEHPIKPQVPVPTTRAADALMQQLRAAAAAQRQQRQQQKQQQQQQQYYYPHQAHNYEVGESSTSTAAGGYVAPYASCSRGSFYASHFGAHSPRLNAAPAAPTPAATPNPGAAGAGLFNPIASFHPSETPTPTPSPGPSTSHFQLMPSAPPLGAAACFPPWGGNSGGRLNPYASSFQSTLSANPVGYYRSWIPTPARRHPTLEQVRSRLVRRPMEHDLLASPEAAAHVERLLEDGDAQVRRSVLARVRQDVRSVSGSSERLAVFLALVKACEGRPDELQDIVHAVYNANGYLVSIARHNQGLTAVLKELVKVLAPYPQMLVHFIGWLLRERLMQQYNDTELLENCFTMMHSEDRKIIIQFAIAKADELLFSSFGSKYLAACFVYARDEELHALETIILSRTVEIAMGQYSNYFLQRAIECGSKFLQVSIADRVAADVVSVASDRFGSYVVEACFLLSRTPVPLQRLLAAVGGLPGDVLADMVRGDYSNYVVSCLLETARNYFPQEARALARRIERLPAAVQREMHARKVMAIVSKLTHNKNQRSRATLY